MDPTAAIPTTITITAATIMLDDFLFRAVLAGLGLVLATGALGCFVIWRRMAYFGDSTAHAAILGVALSLAFSVPVYLGTLGIALAMALLVAHLTARGQSMDTVLGVLAHSALALGLVAASFVPSMRTGLDAYLFGDILAVTRGAQGMNWLDDNGRAQHMPTFPVHTVDTLGAGDVFHGAFALAVAEGSDIPEAMRFASAAAALKTTRHGGAFAAPSRNEVMALLAKADATAS